MKRLLLCPIFFVLGLFALCGVANASAPTLISGSEHSGLILAGGVVVYDFTGNAGETVYLMMDEAASSTGEIHIYKPDGSLWKIGSNFVIDELPDTGTYDVHLKLGNSAHSSLYGLQYVNVTETVENGSLVSGTSALSNFSTFDIDSYDFTGNAGETVFLALDEAVSGTGFIHIYKPDGSFWQTGSNFVHEELPDTGTYTVIVRLSKKEKSGDYGLQYVNVTEALEYGSLVSGSSVLDTLSTFDIDSYDFTGNAGETVFLELDETVTGTGFIHIYKPDGSFWKTGSNLVIDELPDTGTYTVIVRFARIEKSGDYGLQYVNVTDTVENGSLIRGISTSDALSTYDFDSYTITGLSGEHIEVLMFESTSALGQIYIYKPDGSLWTSGSNSASGLLPEAGTYTVVVKFSKTWISGNYSLEYNLIP